ncbi:hypothetical protein RP20_CCG004752 [Aedes albopictus]|nr:hypothetical protein RP20_CCG004752 [Aedes albopictus]
MMYNTTPHSTTGKTPTELLSRKTIRSKIPSISDIETVPPKDGEAQDRDTIMKYKGKLNEDSRRHAQVSEINEGDLVLLQNLLPGHKLSTTFSPIEYVVLSKTGNRVKVRDPISGNTYERNSAHVKKITNSTKETNDFAASSGSIIDPLLTSNPSTSPSDLRPPRTVQRPFWQKDYVAHVSSDKSP